MNRLRLIAGLVLLVLVCATHGGDSCGPDDCRPAVCCPAPATTKKIRYIYKDRITERCFPPTLCDWIKHCLGWDGGDCGCDGKPRAVHTLLKKKIVEEQPTIRYQPTPACCGGP